MMISEIAPDIFNVIRDGLFTTDNSGLITFVNAPLAKMLGLEHPEEMTGKHFNEFVSSEFRAEISDRFKRAVEDESYAEIVEFSIVRKDGGIIFVQLKHGPIIRKGQIVGTAGVIRDVTDRKRAEQALSASEKKYRDIVENMTDVVYVIDQTGKLLFITPSATRMLGYEQSEMIGHNIQEFTYREDLSPALNNINHAILQRGIISNEYRLVRKDGGILWIQTLTRPLFEENDVVAAQGSFWDITERKHAEEALRKSEERFRRCFELGLIGMAISLPTKEIVDVNDEICRILGYDREELLKKTWAELTHPNDLAAEVTQFNRAMNGEIDGYAIDKRFIRKDGQVIDASISVRAMRRADGSLECFLGLLQDVTERKRAEEAIHRSNELLSRAQEIGHLGSWELDLVHNRLSWSDEVYRIFGLQPQEFGATYEAFLAAVHPEDRAAVDGAYSGSLRDGKGSYEVEHRIVRKSTGEVRVVHEKCDHFRDNQGRVVRSVGMVRDITESRRAEEALRESEEKFRSLVETTSDWIWEVDAEGVYTYASPRVRDLLGYEPEEVLGRKPFEFMPPEESTRVMAEFSRIVKERKGCVGLENVNIGRDGRRVVLETSCVPRLDARGNLLGYRGIDRDITDRKRAEEALRRSHDELEYRVSQRTAELEHKNRELQEFAFVAAHDLREPLRKIQTFGSYLLAKKADRLDDEGKDYISRMADAANRVQELLDALLRYTRIETKGQQFIATKLDDVARKVIRDLEVEVRKIGAHVEVGPLPTVMGDPNQLRQLFQNLIGNALKYYRSEVVPHIKIYGEEDNRACRIFVEDNGIGFDEKYLNKIFQPFQRLHGKHEYPGLGIGLAICKKIVERHGGSMTASSTLGKGSTFIVKLPVKESKQD